MSKGARQVNGAKGGSNNIDTFDVDDPEFVRHLRRPVEVKQDVRQMEERKRVNLILKSKLFRQELENIVVEQLQSGGEREQPSSDQALKEISNLLPPSSQNRIIKTNALLGGTTIIPISDFNKVDVSKYGKGEKLTRSKLAACCRLIDVFGWSHGDQSFVSASVENGQYLVVGNGQLYSEVTSGGLIKVDDAGNVIDQGSTNLAVNQDTADLNIAVHESKNNVACVVFLNNPSVISVSAMDCGLLPLSQDAMSLGQVQTVDWGAGGDSSSRDVARQAFTAQTKVVLLRNAGAVIAGESVEEAFHVARSLMNAVDTQLRTIPLGLDNICLPSEETRRKAYERANRTPSGEDGKRRWKRGELEFEALMRHLENSGYKTGYVFHAPLTRQVERTDRVNAEVEVPPASTSFAYGEDDLNNSLKERVRKDVKTDWLNSPNAYKKEEIEEKGAPKPKKITKWVPETGPGALIKIDNPNQFAPVGTDPKELKAKYKAIRKDHFDENITAGPQSRILEGVTWEEAQKIKEGNVQSDTIIVVGAASRGIIQRDHQVSSNVYKTYYAPNPFDNVTEEDVEEYKAEILRKTKGADSRGLTTDDDEEMIVPGPDGKLISSDERMQQVRHTQAEAGPGRQTPEVLSDSERVVSPNSPKDFSPVAVTPPVVARESVTSPTKPGAVLQSPTRSTSSGEGLHGDRSGTEGGTETESATPATGSEKKKKKRGFRMPSFSSKKKEKQ